SPSLATMVAINAGLSIILLLWQSCVVTAYHQPEVKIVGGRSQRALNLSYTIDDNKMPEDEPVNKTVWYRVKEYPISCNVGKVNMEIFSFGCNNCTCHTNNNSATCLKNVLSCDFGDKCYQFKDTWAHGKKMCSCSIGIV
ncbi:unnamed protein product, partial [Meganyctiphanes norvegica]